MTAERNNSSNAVTRQLILIFVFSLFAFLIFLSQQAYASSFTAYADNSEINACKGALTSYNVFIKNNGNRINSYQTYSENKEATIYPSFIVLAPSEASKIVVFINPKTANTSQLNIYISNNEEKETQVLSQTLNVVDCYKIDFTLSKPEAPMLCGKNTKANLEIRNSGLLRQNISLTMNDAAVFEKPDNNILLLPGKSINKTIIINSSCANTAEKNLELLAVNLENSAFNRKTFSIKLLTENEAYNIQISPSRISANYNYQEKKIRIKNAGAVTANYTISIESPNWATINSTFIELAPGRTKNISLYISPDNSVVKGKYKATLSAVKERSDISYSQDIIIELSPTFTQFAISIFRNYIVPYYLFIILGMVIIRLFITLALVIKASKRKRADNLKKEMIEGSRAESVDSATFIQRWKRISPHKSAVMAIDSEDECVTKIEVLANKDLHEAQLKLEKLSGIDFAEPDSTVYEYFRLDKKNINDSDISHGMIKFRIPLMWLKESKITANNICLARHRKRWEYFDAEFRGTAEGFAYYQSKISGFSCFAIVEKNQEVAEQIGWAGVEEKIKPKRVEEELMPDELKKRKKERFVVSGIIILAVILLALILFYIANQFPEKERQIGPIVNNSVNNSAINEAVNETANDEELLGNETLTEESYEYGDVLARQAEIDEALAFIENNNITDSINYQIISRNQKLTMNLNYIFKDPDNDILEYSFVPSENLNITITDYNVLIIIPRKEWYGVEKIELFANDGQTVASSGEINIIVLDSEQEKQDSLTAFFKTYKYQIIIGLGVLLLFVFSALLMKSSRSKRRRY